VIGSGEGASLAYRKSILGQLADVSGLKLRRRRSTYDGAQNIDELADAAKTLEILAEGTLKIAKDFRLLMSGPRHGLNEIEWPMLIKGSTFFKGKNNPTIPETVMQGCFLILGQATVVQQCHLHGELNLNVFEGAAGFALQEAVQTAVRTLRAWNDHGLADVYALQRGAQ
jgi:aspartate ammonia-lyase